MRGRGGGSGGGDGMGGKGGGGDDSNADSDVDVDVDDHSDTATRCAACGSRAEDRWWVQCDDCGAWLHLRCTGLKRVPGREEAFACNDCVVKRVQVSWGDAWVCCDITASECVVKRVQVSEMGSWL